MLWGRELTAAEDGLATPEALTLELQQRLHLFGRYGITMFAISGADIALWDLVARSRGQPLRDLLGVQQRDQVTAYASLVRYGDVDRVRAHCERAVADGYRYVKLHEILPETIRAGRAAVGPDVGLSVDVNCVWTEAATREQFALLREIKAIWIEEPVFPPEDIRAQARLNRDCPLGAGENACTRQEFARILEAGAVSFAQPSVIKVGGVTEFNAVAQLAATAGVPVMPHSPYFGPGYFTTLQLAAVLPGQPLFEHLYVQPQADLAVGGTPLPQDGSVALPDGPGHGFEPDLAVLERYRVGGNV